MYKEFKEEVTREYFDTCKVDFYLNRSGLQISIATESTIQLQNLIKSVDKNDLLIFGIRIIRREKGMLINIVCIPKP